jgi:pimeloyl-ACP methyl ester carboxylesterase
MGHSFGGFIALNLAIQYPELVECIVAEEPIFEPALLSNPKNPLQLLALMVKNFEAGKSLLRLGMKGIDPAWKALATGDKYLAANAFINGVTKGLHTPDSLDELTKTQLYDNIEALEGEDPFKNNLDLKDAQRISCPVLLIGGTESPYIFRYINDQLQAIIPKVTRITVTNVGHWVHIENPQEFTRIIKRFFNSH